VAGIKYLQKIGSKKRCFSVDIKSATDSIPVILSEKIFSILLNPRIVENPDIFCKDIFTILTNRTFSLNNKKIRYGVGQPMGAYASFPLLALTNHVMVQVAAMRAGVKSSRKKDSRGNSSEHFFSEYAIVGDDVVICNEKVAVRYYELLESLDIPISTQKCVDGYGTFEFCHRVVRNGELVSVPSWNSYATSIISQDPVPLMTLYKSYGLEMSYNHLCNFFDRKFIRTACAFEKFSFKEYPQGLAVEVVPANVIGHAVRALEIQEVRNRTTCAPLDTNDKFLNRLNYCINIQKMFKSSKFETKFKPKKIKFREVRLFKVHKKTGEKTGVLDGLFYRKIAKRTPVWDIAHKVIASTFYLNYLYNYKNRKKLYRSSFSIRSGIGLSLKLRAYCMSQKTKWLDDRLLNLDNANN